MLDVKIIAFNETSYCLFDLRGGRWRSSYCEFNFSSAKRGIEELNNIRITYLLIAR